MAGGISFIRHETPVMVSVVRLKKGRDTNNRVLHIGNMTEDTTLQLIPASGYPHTHAHTNKQQQKQRKQKEKSNNVRQTPEVLGNRHHLPEKK